MTNIKISFCLPVYNVEKYINSCLDSIEAQNLNENEYEIICIDDCSTDNSYNILLERAKINNNIKVLKNKENCGASYTRNRLIDEAKGKYIWFIDSDDMIALNSAKNLISLSEKNNADIISFNFNHNIDESFFDFKKYPSIFTNKSVLYMGQDNLKNLSYGYNCMYIVKKEFLNNNNIKFVNTLRSNEDALFTFDISLYDPYHIKINSICYLYRINNSSLSHSNVYYENLFNLYDIYKNRLQLSNEKKDEIIKLRMKHCIQSILLNLLFNNDKVFVYKEINRLIKLNYIPLNLQINELVASCPIKIKLLTLIILKPNSFKLVYNILHFFRK